MTGEFECMVWAAVTAWGCELLLYYPYLLLEDPRRAAHPLHAWCVPPVLALAARLFPSHATALWLAFHLSCGVAIALYAFARRAVEWIPTIATLVAIGGVEHALPIALCALASVHMYNERPDVPTLAASGAIGGALVVATPLAPSAEYALLAAVLAAEAAVYALGCACACPPSRTRAVGWAWHAMLFAIGLRCVDATEWADGAAQHTRGQGAAEGVWWLESRHGLPIVGRYMVPVRVGSIATRRAYVHRACFAPTLNGALWCYLGSCLPPVTSIVRERGNALECTSTFVLFARLPRAIDAYLGISDALSTGSACVRHEWSRCGSADGRRVLVATDLVQRRIVQSVLVLLGVYTC